MDKRVTIAEVAKAAGVSKTTVSVVLNGGGSALGIRPETQSQVLDAANTLGYTPNHAARMLRKGRTGILTMLVQDLANPLFVDMAVAARATAAAKGYELEVVDAGPLEAEVRALEHLRGARTDGVIVATGRHYVRQPAVRRLLDLVERGMPAVVLIDQPLPGPGGAVERRVPAIRADVFGGSLAAVRHLVGLGHRRIAHVALRGSEDLEREPSSQGDRYRAWRQALREVGIEPASGWLLRGPDTLAGGREMAARLLALEPRPTAVFVYNDLTAIGVLRGLAEAGAHVPEDVAVVSFDGVELGAYVTPALTTVRIPGAPMAARAVETVFELMAEREVDVLDRVEPAELVVRESCGARRS